MAETPTLSDVRSVREKAIIDFATQLFLEQGIEQVKMTDIAETSGIGVASLYRYFKTKDNLVVAAGTLLWQRYARFFRTCVAEELAACKTGLARMEVLLQQCGRTYVRHPEYLAFLDEFDRIILADKVDRKQLVEYAREIASYRVYYQEAFDQGIADNSIRSNVDFEVFFPSTTHALIGVAQKLMRGEILPTESFSNGERELDCIVAMAIDYLRSE